MQAAATLRWSTRPAILAIAAFGALATPVAAAAEGEPSSPLQLAGGPPPAAPTSPPEPTEPVPAAESAESIEPAAGSEAAVPSPPAPPHPEPRTEPVAAAAPDIDGGSNEIEVAASDAVGSARDAVGAIAAHPEGAVRATERSAEVVVDQAGIGDVTDAAGVRDVVDRTKTETGAALDKTIETVGDSVGATPVGGLIEATGRVREAAAPVRDLVQGSSPLGDLGEDGPGTQAPADDAPSPAATLTVDPPDPPTSSTAPPVVTAPSAVDLFAPAADVRPRAPLGAATLPRPTALPRANFLPARSGRPNVGASSAGLFVAPTVPSPSSDPVLEPSHSEPPAQPLPTLPSSTSTVASSGFGQGSFTPIAALVALLALSAPAILSRLREAACSAAGPFVCAIERPG